MSRLMELLFEPEDDIAIALPHDCSTPIYTGVRCFRLTLVVDSVDANAVDHQPPISASHPEGLVVERVEGD